MSKKETKTEEVVSEELAKEFEEAKEEFNEMTGGEEPPKKKKNYTALIVIAAILVVLASIFGVTKLAKNYKKKTYGDTSTTVEKDEKAKEVQNNLSSDKKEIVGIKTEDNKKSETVSNVMKQQEKQNTTDAYKKYEKLSDEQKAAQKVVPSKEKSPYKNVEEVKDVIEYDEAGLPNKYNLNNKIRITVPNQKGYDLSWAFASMKTAETNYALGHKFKMPDFSEMHLDYFESSKYYGYRDLHSGGGFYTFENYLADNGGIVSENNMPFVDTDDIVKVVNNKREYFVNSTIYYPDYYYLDYDYETNTKNEMWENSFKDYMSVLKYHLVNFGALYATIMSPTPGASYFNNKTNALYFDGNYNDDYSYYFNRDAVTIVGYDDTYSKDNFKSSSKPSRDGAFIGMLADGKDAYDKGYIYISYEDMVVTSDVHGVLSTDIEDAVKVSDIKSHAIKDVLLSKFGYAIIEYNGEQYIPEVALNRSISIDLSNKSLTEEDLNGLSIFSNISSLNLSHNKLSDFDYLANSINNVGELDISDNNYTFIPTYLPYKNVSYINLEGNNVSNVAGLSALNVSGLSISSDNSVYGLNELTNLFSLDISNTNFNIDELKNLADLYYLDVKDVDLSGQNISLNSVEYFTCDNCNISSLESLQFSDIYGLDLPNNQITNLSGIEGISKIRTLNLSNNKLTDISGIEKASKIIDLDLSYNKEISDYSSINDLFEENEYPTYEETVKDWEDAPSKDKLDIKYYFRDDDERLNVSNNNISDISIFNNIDVYNLDLSSNPIEDVSGFNNDNIMEINLAYNKDIKGLDKLSNVRGLSLANANISDISIIKDFKNLTWINLANNDVKDITPLNKLDRLGFVSLENNTNQEGELNNKNITTLNISNCNLNSLDKYNVENLTILNISKNKNLENNIDKLKDNNQSYFDIIAEDLVFNYDDINDLKGPEDNVYVDGATIVYKANKEGNKVKIDDEKLAKKLFEYVSYGVLETENGSIGRLGKYITLEHEDLGNVNVYNQSGMYYRIEY